MSVKFLFVVCAFVCLAISLEAASLGKTAQASSSVVQHKLDYEGVQENIRSARQAYEDEVSSEDSDEDDEEEDAEIQHQDAIRQQQAQELSINDSPEDSDEDDEDAAADDDDDYFGRRMKRDVTENASNNEVQENSKPNTNEETQEEEGEDKEKPAIEITPASSSTPSSTTPGSPNTSVLILIRDAIKKVTELPNTQQVATSAQQYFQLFEHFLQQTIEQVIGDDDDEDEVESTTIVPETESEKETESSTQLPQTVSESMDKESLPESSQPQQPDQANEQSNEIKA